MRLANGIVVRYTDAAGVVRTVGPPESSADFTDARLADTSSANPVTAHGLRRWDLLEIRQVATMAAAVQIALTWAAEQGWELR